MVSIRQRISNMKSDFKERREQNYHASRQIKKKAHAEYLKETERATIKVQKEKAQAHAQPLSSRIAKGFSAGAKAVSKLPKQKMGKKMGKRKAGLRATNPFPIEKKEDVYAVKGMKW